MFYLKRIRTIALNTLCSLLFLLYVLKVAIVIKLKPKNKENTNG